MTVVQFLQFSSLVQPAFWHELMQLKVDVLRLSDDPITISGTYTIGRFHKDRETGQDIDLGCNLIVGADSFNAAPQSTPFSIRTRGVLKNYNTIEEFHKADKKALFNNFSEKIWEDIIASKDASILTQFLVITFADLKKYKFHYWFAFPAFVSKPAWEISAVGWKTVEGDFSHQQLSSIYNQLQMNTLPFFLVRFSGDNVELAPVDKYEEFFADRPPESIFVGFIDPSASEHAGWPLRNLLAYLHLAFPVKSSNLRVLCWRDSVIPFTDKSWRSRLGDVSNPSDEIVSKPSAVGWEKTLGKFVPRFADLAPMMDPSRLANQAVDLNLKLMRWRIMPSLDLDKISSTKCLLLGAGTLGCYVARTLMGWGVRTITFVDSARVSFSNPVRQPLFEFEDCLDGGRPKAACAADRLKKIFPGVIASGYDLSVPMPGHPIPSSSNEKVKADVRLLENLFDEHDVVFLLMDSRESRWLPTVLGASKGKIVMNAALGFDTYLVMRHGPRASTSNEKRLGCYYCNDIVAPADSLTDRTLDQMCTVTRPGLASIAASTAVELLVSLLQHEDGIHAPAPPPQASNNPPEQGHAESILGLVPHQLRGYLAQFRTIPIVGAAYSKCTGCSETVLKTYEEDGFDMLLRAFNEQGYLESLTGLDKLYEEGDAIFESVEDWDDDDH